MLYKLKHICPKLGITNTEISKQFKIKYVIFYIIMINERIVNNKHQQNKIDILIVGAGLSGLTSALKIIQKEPSLRVRILESSTRIGGQLTNTSLGEIGAKWITEDQCHIYRLLNTLQVPIHKRNIVSSQLKNYRELDEGWFASLAKYELQRYINELELKMEFFKPGNIKYECNFWNTLNYNYFNLKIAVLKVIQCFIIFTNVCFLIHLVNIWKI